MQLDEWTGIFAPFAGFRLLVGFSGGADSTAALLAAEAAAKRFGCALFAVHFEHGLRGAESVREAEAAEAFAVSRGIPFRLIRLELALGANQEARARAARLAAYRELAGETATPTAVVLGHHYDDRVENLVLRLLRGSNATGLTGLRPVTRLDGLTIVRPLARASRNEIEAFLRGAGVHSWQTDSSNLTDDYLRNYLRNQVLPSLYERHPPGQKGVRRSLEALTQDADFLEKSADEQFAAIRGQNETPAAFWRELHPALLPRVLRRYLGEIPAGALVKRFAAGVKRGRGRLELGDGRTIRFSEEAVTLLRKREVKRVTWRWREEEEPRFRCDYPEEAGKAELWEAFFDADQLPEVLVIDGAHPGDRMIPFGRTNPESLKKLRIDRKVTEMPPVLRTLEGEIIWAPGIRHSALVTVTEATRRIVRFVFKDLESRTLQK